MIIDLIIDRKDGTEYDEHAFYANVAEYGGDGVQIAMAMDGGKNSDVQRELCKYVIANEYNPTLCNYINEQVWVTDSEPYVELTFSNGKEYVHIYPSCDDDANWAYDIYASKEDYANEEEAVDGGLCTGSLSDAIEMAIN